MRISRTLPLLLSGSLALAAPLADLTKRQYCAEGSTVCAWYCCLPGEVCVYDTANEGGVNCKPAGDPNYQPVNGVFTFSVIPTPTTFVVTIGQPVDPSPTEWVQTPGITPGNTPGNTPGYTPGNTPSGPLTPPTHPTGTHLPGTTTGSFITAIPTGTGVVPVPITGGGGGLTAGQIGGIIGGVIGGLGLLGLLLLWCCLYGMCAAFRKKRGSDSSSSSGGERKTWKTFIPVALGGAALAGGRHRHSHHSQTTITTEKKKEGGGFFGGKTAIIGTLGAAYLWNKFRKKDEEVHYQKPPYQGAVSGHYSGSSSYDSSHTSSTGTRSDVSSSYLSHSSSSSGFRSVDSRSPPPARAPPRRYNR